MGACRIGHEVAKMMASQHAVARVVAVSPPGPRITLWGHGWGSILETDHHDSCGPAVCAVCPTNGPAGPGRLRIRGGRGTLRRRRMTRVLAARACMYRPEADAAREGGGGREREKRGGEGGGRHNKRCLGAAESRERLSLTRSSGWLPPRQQCSHEAGRRST